MARKSPRSALALLAAAGLLLTGCSGPSPFVPKVDPWVVADHDAKMGYHAAAGEELLGVDIHAGLASLQAFQAVGYLHIDTESNGSAHYEYLTSVDGESYVSRRVSDRKGDAFDQSHQAGSADTYYLLGDNIKNKLSNGKSWVQIPSPDLERMSIPERNCSLYAVSFLCAVVDAWNTTNDSVESLPVLLSGGEAGDRHFSTAVTFDALVVAGLIPEEGQFSGFISEESRSTLIPLHLWVAEDGVVTKIEVNGVITGDNDATLKLQIGFEITSREASTELVPVSPGDIPASDLLRITTQQQLDEFVNRLSAL